MKRLSLFLVLILVVSVVSGCASTGPDKTIKQFEKAYNKGDVNGMLDCFDPVIVKGIRAILNISGSFLPINPNDVLDLVPFICLFDDSGGMPQISISVYKAEIDGDKAELSADAKSVMGDETETAQVRFYMEKQEGKWYIMTCEDID